ncbi:MAG: glycosyltransferase family 2 protein [Anaerolineales bacterium]|nr:glycosyltransferase family 2 protein [Anaerolineales bacterium]MCB0005569.1 glycosyltransferase family 2 protein [Anaerolineales bacterium]MCB0018360.1 glycosyltransferase family 2 protein [Anaerolineales bacterium]MCB0029996.1 glycosyltransferase family 2 protein [Anaerolineales bacterium]
MSISGLNSAIQPAMNEADTLAEKDLSLVIPMYNEVENLRLLVEEITVALAPLDLDYEILFVDDGSDDGSFDLLEELHEADPRVCVISFRRNFGQTAGFAAGFAAARGAVVITMDADRQNDPADIPALLNKLAEGHDVVNGWRHNRQDNFVLRKLPSMIANQLIAQTSGVKLHDRGCSMRAMRLEVAQSLNLYGEMHRFIPELIHSAGFSMTEVPVNHRARVAGTSKYGLSRTFRVLLDLATVTFLHRYGSRPMHLFGGVGFGAGALGTLFCLYLAGSKLWSLITGGLDAFRANRIGERPLLLLGVLLIILSVQFLIMGLLAELMVRTYYESQGKAAYHIRTILRPDSQVNS